MIFFAMERTETEVWQLASNDAELHPWSIRGHGIVDPATDAKSLMFLVAKGGIEPPTQGFSVLCSTN